MVLGTWTSIGQEVNRDLILIYLYRRKSSGSRAGQSVPRLETKNMIHKRKTDKSELIRMKQFWSVKDPVKAIAR